MTLAPTPPMGWNSWNMFGATIDADIVRQTADTLVASGLKEAGYQYVVIDDFWHGGRGEDGRLFPHPEKFSEGMKAVADYIHSRGLKFGMYSDAGPRTCGGCPASQDHEEIDAQTFAEWEIDYLKYDWCHAEDTRANAEYRYARMSNALKATGREIVLSICEWGHHSPWLWGKEVGGQLWRTTGDMGDSWSDINSGRGLLPGIESIGFEQQRGLEAYAGPGHWNDPDMLVVGLRGISKEIAGAGCTETEYRTHFSLWCMLASPLMIGCDVRALDQVTLETLTNTEVIALDQDSLGAQGFRVSRTGRCEVWKKNLKSGALGVALFNRDEKRQRIRTHWSDLQITGAWQARDLWLHEDLGRHENEYSCEVPPHGCTVLKFTPEG
jgi:alpha-galactosidase